MKNAWLAINPHISHFPVRSPDFQSAFRVIASAKPTASRRSRMLAFYAVHEISGLAGLFRDDEALDDFSRLGERFNKAHFRDETLREGEVEADDFQGVEGELL